MRKALLTVLVVGLLAFTGTMLYAASFGSQSSDMWGRTVTDSMKPVRVTDAGMLLSASQAPDMALKIVEVGTSVYIGQAAIGSAQSAAVWQARKVSVSGGTTTVTWADGNANYDNVATNLPGLTYN